ncbi:probable L-asparaginase periplasmic [Branchiostoma lanceolatum]|uniref:probable L-asparaginase periplasmic n=1 Tax=Branchiostoma lanceolatum TaxID=7740 RepID=UPI003455C099
MEKSQRSQSFSTIENSHEEERGEKLKQDDDQNRAIMVIQTGGTIDKEYPRSMGGYAFEIGSSAAQSILERMNLAMPVEYGSVFRKDSQEINDWDRELLSQVCQASTQSRILITHGTDSMIDTAAYLAKKRLPKTIILTGAFRPEKFKDSDADFNVGVAIGALQTIQIHDVFIAMNGRVYWWNEVTRNQETGQFICKLK